jgi:1,4-alpha-glucan branching enzyme
MNLQDVPAGMVDGVNYHAGDTSVTLVLYAPKKTNVSVIGDFNNWTASLPYVMNLSKDTTRFWLKINGLTPSVEYAYQYVIDDNIKVADYNTEKVLDPNNDSYIPAATYPNLKAYPTGKTTGIVSVLQTAKPNYAWKDGGFVRPNKKNLIIYELLIRDFVQKQNFQTLKDSLNYLNPDLIYRDFQAD